MCIIIAKPVGKTIPEANLKECWKVNPDGVGLMFVENNNLVVIKGLMEEAEAIKTIMSNMEREMVIHFRRASPNMAVCAELTHPFHCATHHSNEHPDGAFQLGMVHNGRLEWGVRDKSSDTETFFEDVIAPHFERDPWFLTQSYGPMFMERAITTSANSANKLVFLRLDRNDKSHKIIIINDKLGNWDNGIWFSNYSWKIYPSTAYGNTGFYGSGPGQAYPGGTPFRTLWEMPDQNGWRWDFDRHGWLNDFTKVFTYDLVFRTEKPYSNYHISIKTTKVVTQTTIPGVTQNLVTWKKKKVNKLYHLEHHEIDALCAFANAYLMDLDMTAKERSKLSKLSKIEFLRSVCHESIETCKHMEEEFLDMWMIAAIKDGSLQGEIDNGKAERKLEEAAEKHHQGYNS